jgi:hypothetical protein
MDKYKLNNQAIVEAVERVMKRKGFHLIPKKTSSFILNWFFFMLDFSSYIVLNAFLFESDLLYFRYKKGWMQMELKHH